MLYVTMRRVRTCAERVAVQLIGTKKATLAKKTELGILH